MTDESTANTRQKALAINLDASTYGTFAEIGGGQEVARWFFLVGGAAGTVAKTISAYDMSVSDQLYGQTSRYVSRQRLEAMLEQEFVLLNDRLKEARGDTKRFFSFADTVATRAYGKEGTGRGWLGVRFQAQPHEAPSQIIIHVQLRDTSTTREQDALGILGVNLIYGAFVHREDPQELIGILMDDLSRERVEIDMIKFSGPAFVGVDNRLMSLQLVERGLTDAAMFTAAGDTVQPSEVLYKRPILVERGSFRPPTKLTLDLLQSALKQFKQEPSVRDKEPLALAEMTLRSLTSDRQVSHVDFLAQADILRSLGIDVLISRFEPYYQLAEYLSAYTDQLIGLAVGLPTVGQIADERYYADLPGGVLESAGRLFKRNVKMYVYPTRDPKTGEIHSAFQGPVSPPWHHLRALLLDIEKIVPIRGYDESLLSIHTPDVLDRIMKQDPTWEDMVPPAVAEIIKTENLFGCRAQTAAHR
ncbi:MAG: TonB-dependent receptor [Anaerolineae bacterium]|nr:TonB-dependent receptor [Phycisphaerae bacterium]